MKIVSRALRVALAGGMVAGAFAVAQPSDSDAAVTVVGACASTRGIATAKSTYIWPADLKAAGLTNDNHDASISTKGVHSVGGTVGTVGGSCGFVQAIANGATTTAPAGTRTLLKWSSKVTSPVVDCVSDTDAAEWPLSGKLGFAYTDLTKTDGYITTANPTGSIADEVTFVGVVTKGIGVGAQISTNIGFAPAVKDKLQTADWDGATSLLSVPNPIQGYAADGGATLGCAAAASPATANIRSLIIVDGPISQVLLTPLTGTVFTIGAA